MAIGENERKADTAGATQAKETLDHAPETGDTVSDYFAFEEIFARVLATADHELQASSKFLFWSGLTAGFALGLSFLAKVIFTDVSGETSPGLLGNLLYPIGFLIVVIGRYQLITENTLTPVVLVLTKLASVGNLLRLWAVVFVANMLGAIGVAALFAYGDMLDTKALVIALQIGHKTHDMAWTALLSKALIGGWIIASMVWLVHAAMDTMAKVLIVWLLMYFVGVGGFVHVATSPLEVFFLSFRGNIDFWPIWPNQVLPILLGNIVGGIVFVSVINYVQFGEHEDGKLIERYGDRLSWREWIFGRAKAEKDGNSPTK